MKYAPSSAQVISKMLDGEAIVIDLNSGIYYSMDGTAAKIWNDLCGGVDSDVLASAAKHAYPENTEVLAEINTFIGILVSDGLLVEKDMGATKKEPTEELGWPQTYGTPERMSFDDVAEMVALDPPLPELQSYASDS